MRDRAKSPAMEARARDALETGKDRFAAEREAMAKRLGQALGLEAPEIKAVADAGPAPAAKGWVPVLFVSSSMPTSTLRTYAAQLEKARGRSEEHTSELQSLMRISYAVFCLKKKKHDKQPENRTTADSLR